jgi:hypothetical protein
MITVGGSQGNPETIGVLIDAEELAIPNHFTVQLCQSGPQLRFDLGLTDQKRQRVSNCRGDCHASQELLAEIEVERARFHRSPRQITQGAKSIENFCAACVKREGPRGGRRSGGFVDDVDRDAAAA